MADKAITDLNTIPGSVDDNNTWFAVAQSGTAYKVSGHEFILAVGDIWDSHGGIKSIVYTPPVSPSLTGTMVITLADDSTTNVSVQNGKGITSIAKTSSSGLADTYTITYNDGTTSTFTVTNGEKGDTGDAWYMWIRYAANCSGTPPLPPSDQDIGTDPDNWIGIYSGTASTAPTTRQSYTWFEMKGEKGDTGDSIDSIVWTSGTHAPGTNDTYTAYAGGEAVGTFTVYNGSDGQGSPGSQNPIMDGTATPGTANAYSREDHVHPTDTSRASQADLADLNSALTSVETALDNAILLSGVKKITGNGTNNYTLTGLTADHVVANWGMYSDSACTTPIPENAPTCDLTLTTAADGWTLVVENFSATFYMKPTFILKQN